MFRAVKQVGGDKAEQLSTEEQKTIDDDAAAGIGGQLDIGLGG